MKNVEIDTLLDYVVFLIDMITMIIIVTILTVINFWYQIAIGIFLALAIKSIVGA